MLYDDLDLSKIRITGSQIPFDIICRMVFLPAEILLSEHDARPAYQFDEFPILDVLVQLDMFDGRCTTWLRSSKVDNSDKTMIRVTQRKARVYFVAVSRLMERKPNNSWTDQPLPKTHDVEEARKWVRLKLVERLDDFYDELTPEQKEFQAALKLQADEFRTQYVPSNSWVDTPMFGEIPPDSTEK